MIDFQLDGHSGVATYLQLAQQVRHSLRLGLLRPGDKLPTAKEVVAKLAINPNTVLKAYRELEREGLVGARPGAGTFVTGTLPSGDPGELEQLARELAQWLRAARQAGLGREDVEALYGAAMRETFQEPAPGAQRQTEAEKV
ncbi:GntR family transcriptional regulator [Actinocrinis puniceicyclus]|uniref:GntR family transcriptional regulator n=1 Tax=Actinocrinis puniceicyclus TaxID=977794 RepID=A0A8J7WUU8_9ACTN|nr:GntR family transcriptional regulator [Actinocrinis puniceicyclus]MBS2966362.1 GntR family transcriptional regulator [Actinocrinis puniceicyclus]